MTDLDGRYPHFSANRAAAPSPAEAKQRGDHPVSEQVHLVGGAFWGSDPQAELTWMRASAPVYWDDRGQAWGISKHADVKYASLHPEIFSSAGGIRPDAPAVPQLIDMDGDAHLRRRKLVSQGFTARRVAGFLQAQRFSSGDVFPASTGPPYTCGASVPMNGRFRNFSA